MYIQSLSISNLRCFQQAELNFQYPGREDGAVALPNVNLALGNNGSGKTTILKAIALATLSPIIESAGFVPYHLVRRSRSEMPTRATVEAEVLLHAQDIESEDKAYSANEKVMTTIKRIRDIEKVSSSQRPIEYWENMYDDRSPAFLIVGYGASRRIESVNTYDEGARRQSRQLRYQRVAGLFEEQVTLTPLGAWLPKLKSENPGRYKQIVTLINLLLPEECRFTEQMEGNDLLFDHRGAVVPFAALSDGYRAYIAWVTDLLYHVWMGSPGRTKLVDTKGIVLVDEIDLHLHPEWQRTVVPRLAMALPNLQFVFTSHSPIVTGTMAAGNIFVMESDESGASLVRQLQERVHGLSAEQILLSSYFNLPSTRAPGMEDELAKLSRNARKGDTKAAVEYLRRLTEGSDLETASPPKR